MIEKRKISNSKVELPYKPDLSENYFRKCLFCAGRFRGRSDKKFCNDYCRNAYHNKRSRLHFNHVVKVINDILKKNRTILEKLQISEYEVIEISKAQPLKKGFEFEFSTRRIESPNGRTYHFCYEFAYSSIGETYLIGKGKTLF